jgi:hypothetical protein
MEGAMTLNVPVLVESGSGRNWLEAHWFWSLVPGTWSIVHGP